MRDKTNKHLWEYRELKPIRFLDADLLESDLETSDLIWHGIEIFVGVELECIDCKQIFPFSAAEQKIWHHEWGFSIHSYPKKCKDCRKIFRIKKDLLIKLSKGTKVRLDDFNKCNEVVCIIKELYKIGVKINRRHGEKLLYFVNRSEHKNDTLLKFALLQKTAQQGDAPDSASPAR